MQPKYSLIWIIIGAIFVIAACSVSPTIAVVEPTIELPPPTVVQTAIAPTDSPTAIQAETVAPTFTIEIPTDIPATGDQTSTGQGDQIMQSVCTVCHSSDRIVNSHKTQAEWETTVNRMVSHGAVLSDSDKTILLLYLSETYK
jgi:hypothetical protein